ncbi:MAG: prolipoprotein diacylglyceryl transferase family protein [Rickettsiales bacterium]|jgi:phosphatidylglycerol:prolipoprotein diacylglycerol transferase
MEAHLIFEILSYFLGFRYYQYLRRKNTDVISDDNRLSIIIGGIFGAGIISKLLGYFEHPELLSLSKENIAYIFASKTIVGGLLGAVLGVEITKKILGIKRSTGDLFCFPTILGIMIGRLGCFFTGAKDGTWGNKTNWITGIDSGDGILRHPTPLYEIAVLGLIWLLLNQLKNKVKLQEGSIFKIFMFSYLAWRFIAEFIKPVYIIEPLGISSIQLACLFGMTYYYKVIFNPKNLLVNQNGN